MNIKVLLFAHLREMVGTNELTLDLQDGSKGADLLDLLQSRYPEIEKHRRFLKLSMNGKYIQSETELENQSEIAVFPPVSGG